MNGFESGASLRVSTIKAVLEELNLAVETTTIDKFRSEKSKHFDLVVLTPFSAAKVARRARRTASWLWLDACDSWVTTRISRIKHGEFKQILALVQDFIFNVFHPKYDLLSFISVADIGRFTPIRKKTLKGRYVFPNRYQNFQLTNSELGKVVFIGDGAYEPNRQAVIFLVQVAKFLPSDIKIHIIGKGYACTNSSLVFEGYRDDKELYFSKDIHVAPIFAGAGIKNKVAIPLTLGLQVITTKHGLNGLEPTKNLMIAEKPQDFADAILTMLTIKTTSASPENVFKQNETSKLLQDLRKFLHS